MSKRNWIPIMCVSLAAVACVPERGDNDGTAGQVAIDQEIRTQLAQFRSEVEGTVTDLRTSVQELRQEVRTDQRERWDDLSGQVAEMDARLQERLQELSTVSVANAQSTRRQTAEQLAELEGTVAQAELEMITERQAFVNAAQEKLDRLETDLEEMTRRIMEVDTLITPGTANDLRADSALPARGASNIQLNGSAIDLDRVENLRTDVSDLRNRIADIAGAPADQDELADMREDVASRVAETTREVREALYDTRWTVHSPAI